MLVGSRRGRGLSSGEAPLASIFTTKKKSPVSPSLPSLPCEDTVKGLPVTPHQTFPGVWLRSLQAVRASVCS